MIKIAIVEDQIKDAEKLRECCDRYAEEKGLSFSIKTCGNGFDFMTSGDLDYDIIMLDIKMPYMNGLQTAKKIRESNENVVIGFITSLQRYAIYGYEVRATDFILKPVQYESFSAKFDRILAVAEKGQGQTIAVKTNRMTRYLKLSDIFLIESQRHKLIYHTISGEYETWGTMKEIYEKLKGSGFDQCSSSYLVNLRYVEALDGENVVIQNQSYPISRLKRKSFLDALTFFYS